MVFWDHRIKIWVLVIFPAILSVVAVIMSRSSAEENSTSGTGAGAANGNDDSDLPKLIVFDLGKTFLVDMSNYLCVCNCETKPILQKAN